MSGLTHQARDPALVQRVAQERIPTRLEHLFVPAALPAQRAVPSLVRFAAMVRIQHRRAVPRAPYVQLEPSQLQILLAALHAYQAVTQRTVVNLRVIYAARAISQQQVAARFVHNVLLVLTCQTKVPVPVTLALSALVSHPVVVPRAQLAQMAHMQQVSSKRCAQIALSVLLIPTLMLQAVRSAVLDHRKVQLDKTRVLFVVQELMQHKVVKYNAHHVQQVHTTTRQIKHNALNVQLDLRIL